MALNEEALAALPEEQKSRYRALEALFRSDGWEWFRVWLVAHGQDQMNRLVNAGTWEDNRKAKGAVEAFERVLAVEQDVEAEYTSFIEELKEKEHTEAEEENE